MRWLLGFVVALAVGACADAVLDVALGGSKAEGVGGQGGGVVPTPCEKKYFACGDGLDDDDDGLVDAADPDCLGPCDNSEDSLFPNLPGASSSGCKLDCFWDAGNGSGNDGCTWDHRCDPLEAAPDYPPRGIACAYDPSAEPSPGKSCSDAHENQPASCASRCGPLTPNGCDCFGCCELPSGSGKFVWLGAEGAFGPCSYDAIDDPTRCPPCTPVPACMNPCGPCEICAGKTDPGPGCTTPSCPDGVASCGPDAPCPAGTYCVTGCCTVPPN